MILRDIIEIAQEYESLSDSEKEALNNVMSGEAMAKQNRFIALPGLVNFLDWLTQYDGVDDVWELRDYISDYLDDAKSVPPKFQVTTTPVLS